MVAGEQGQTNEEYWQNELEDLDLNDGEPAVYIGDERYDSVKELAEDERIDASVESLEYIIWGDPKTEDPREMEKVAGVLRRRGPEIQSEEPMTDGGYDKDLALGELTETGKRILESMEYNSEE